MYIYLNIQTDKPYLFVRDDAAHELKSVQPVGLWEDLYALFIYRTF